MGYTEGKPWPDTAATTWSSSVRSSKSSSAAKPFMVWFDATMFRGTSSGSGWRSTKRAHSMTSYRPRTYLEQYEARLEALERLVGRQALEIEGSEEHYRRPENAPTASPPGVAAARGAARRTVDARGPARGYTSAAQTDPSPDSSDTTPRGGYTAPTDRSLRS